MLKVVSINRCDGTDIIERIEGNGWDIDANRIELNGINARVDEGLENRIITLDGPAVEDLFKNLCDLLKENGELRALLDRDTTRKKYQSNLEKEKNISRELNEECNKLTEKTEELERKHEKAKEYIKELDKILKDTSQELADCRHNNLVLIEQKRELEDNNKQVAKSRDYWHDEWIKLHDDKNALITANENISAEIKRLREEISDLNTINKKLNEKSKEQTYGIRYYDLREMYPCTYSDAAKEILRWIDREMKNGTDYATKIFNKEDVENIFSITFCKVPVEPEVVTNEQS